LGRRRGGVRRFLETIVDPLYQRLAWRRAAFGFEDWRAGGERPEIDRICRRFDRVVRAGALLVEDIDMRSTCCSGGHGRVLAMARAAGPEGDRERVPYR
jgi:hypothetical protein